MSDVRDAMMRSQTDEQLAARWDKEPYLSTDGTRSAFLPNGTAHRYRFDPRVECIPSRWRTDVTSDGYGPNGYPRVRIPRPPVNPILVAFRLSVEKYPGTPVVRASEWLSDTAWMSRIDHGNLPEQIDHAHKVLTRLAALA